MTKEDQVVELFHVMTDEQQEKLLEAARKILTEREEITKKLQELTTEQLAEMEAFLNHLMERP